MKTTSQEVAKDEESFKDGMRNRIFTSIMSALPVLCTSPNQEVHTACHLLCMWHGTISQKLQGFRADGLQRHKDILDGHVRHPLVACEEVHHRA